MNSLAALALLMCVALIWDLATGPANLALSTLALALWDPAHVDAATRIILWDVRLPDCLMALVVGAALALAGAEVQTILNNPLASPFTLGFSQAAAFGAAAGIALNIPSEWVSNQIVVPLLAFVATILAGSIILVIATLFQGSTGVIVLFGIALLFFCEAMTAILQFMSSDEAVREIVFWRLGDLTKADWQELLVVVVAILVVLPFSLRSHASLTAMRGGQEIAAGTGINVNRVRWTSILRVSVLTAFAVSFVGAISFVGLVAPHIARLLLGDDHRFLLPGAAVTGALLLSLASILSKSIIPGLIVPIGITTSVVGVPAFILLILTQRRART